MDDVNKPIDDQPPSVEEVVDLFFGEDSAKPIDFGKGPAKKEKLEVDTSQKKPDKSLTSETKKEKPKEDQPAVKLNSDEERFLAKQINLLKRFEKTKKTRESKQEVYDLRKEETERIRNILRSEKMKKHRIKGASYLAKLKPTQNVLHAANGAITVSSCDHDYRLDHMNGATVISVCAKCSCMKNWTTDEWLFYNEKRKNRKRK